MANMNVRARLEKISNELNEVKKHIAMYSGIDKKDALFIDNVTTDIAKEAASIAMTARDVQGDKSAKKTMVKVRKALGFTY